MLGLTVFESVLERLKAEAREAEDEAGDMAGDEGPRAVRGLPAGFAGLGSGAAFASGAQAAAAYLDLGDEPPPPADPPAPPPPPPHLLRIAPEEIAADLALAGNETVEALLARRRDFARANHPDRAPPELRANATLRMKIANMLIDETIRRIETERRLGLRR
jgi:hypothetical protein